MAIADNSTAPGFAQFANSANNTTLARCPFKEAALSWLETRRPYLACTTFRDYQVYIRTLSLYFGELLINEITADQIRAYQRIRMSSCTGSIINHECSLIQQMRKRLGTWHLIETDYQPIPLPRESPGRCISEREEAKFFAAAFSNPKWTVAAFLSLLSVNTTAGPGEMLHLRIRDVDLVQRTIRISPEGAKRTIRIRVLPLNDAALWAVKSLHARALRLRALLPEHYLVPFVVSGGQRSVYDPTRPQTQYYKSFNEILRASGLSFRPYDFRHTAITRMCEAGVPEETVIAMAGHVNRQMLKIYSHIRIEAKRAAVMALAGKPPASITEMLARAKNDELNGQDDSAAPGSARLRLVAPK